jgi:ABC-2 type transport system ATP-binding protein
MDAIEASGLVKTFPSRGDAAHVEAVAGIDLGIREGEIFGFLGPNGAGKTTCVRVLTTLTKPTAGRARVGGFDVVREAQQVRRTIGVALQDVGLDARATGRELLELQHRLYGGRGEETARRAGELLELVGLADAADRRIQTYSGGMKRRLDLASALVHRPRILFLDEPTSGLDPASRRTVWDEVRRLNRDDGITVFLTTQYLEEADELARRVAIIDVGKIVAQGTPAQLKGSIGADVVTVSVPADRVARAEKALAGLKGLKEMRVHEQSVTLFIPNGSAAVAAVVRLLDDAKVRVDSITVASPTLDDVFLRATGHRIEGATVATAEVA